MPEAPSEHHLNHSGFKSYPLAHRSSRLSAFVIDSVLLSILGAFLAASGIYSAQALLFIFYFTLLHSLYGQTLGKKLLGLKVVSTDHSHPQVTPVLLRETIGRVLNALPFGAGYARALFAKDRKGFHDLIADTIVVQTKAIRQGQMMSFGKMLFLSFSALGLVALSFVYIFLFTSYPLKEWAKNLDLHDIEITGIKGSLARGFSIERFSFKDDTGEVDLQDIRFTYDLSRLFLSEEILIQNVSVGGGVIKATSLPAAVSGKSKEPNIGTDEKENGLLYQKGKKKAFPTVTVENLDISNLRFVSPLSEPFTLERFLVINFKLNQSALIIERIWVESDALDLDVNGLFLNEETFASRGAVRAKVKSQLLPKYLKNDFDFEGRFELGLKPHSIKNLQIAALERRLQVKKSGFGYSVTTYGLSIKKFLPDAPPIENVSLHLEGSWPVILMAPLKGSFQIGKYRFQNVDGTGFVFNRNGKIFRVMMTPMHFLGIHIGGKIIATSDYHPTLNDWLADLYFEKSYPELTPSESEFLSTQLRHFSFKPPVQLTPPIVIATNPEPLKIANKTQASDFYSKKIMNLRRSCRNGSERTCSLLLKEFQAICSRDQAPQCAEVRSILKGRPLRLPAKAN